MNWIKAKSVCRDAFTLVELLVVISIIAMLLAVLMPALRKVRQQGQKVVCMSNMRQMGVALQAYFAENEYVLPPSSCQEGEHRKIWICILNDYVKENLLFRCPADKAKNFLDWTKFPNNMPTDDWNNYRWASYASNGYFDCFSGPVDNINYTKYRKMTRIKRASYCIYACELQTSFSTLGVDHVHSDRWIFNPNKIKAEVAYDRHSDKSNFLFVDGHIECLDYQKTWKYPGVDLWNPATAPACMKITGPAMP